MTASTTYHKLLLTIGPGILMAGAAVGVSHLVQATRAGADFGFSLLWILVLACVSKYPFMEFGPRYAAATGNHLITGYRKMGALAYWLYGAITVGTMFIIQAAVTSVTAGLAEQLFGFGWSPFVWSGFIIALCVTLLLIGRYRGLDITMKLIISVLTLCTFIAVVFALQAGTVAEKVSVESPSYWNVAGLAFIIAFMGWMPIPLDAAVWHSIWVGDRAKQTCYYPSVKEARIDFNLGYIAAAFIGLLFFLLGVLVMFGSNTRFATNSVQFSAQIVELYSQTLGAWSAPLMSFAAFVTMLSTTLAVTDAYPRVVSELWNVQRDKSTVASRDGLIYRSALLVIPISSLIILYFAGENFTILVDFAAGLSFLAAPILAWFNLQLVSGSLMPLEARPGKFYLLFSWLCFVFLVFFAGLWAYWTFLK
jgi:Mn2+/Fe2+ NRAMP family transporter